MIFKFIVILLFSLFSFLICSSFHKIFKIALISKSNKFEYHVIQSLSHLIFLIFNKNKIGKWRLTVSLVNKSNINYLIFSWTYMFTNSQIITSLPLCGERKLGVDFSVSGYLHVFFFVFFMIMICFFYDNNNYDNLLIIMMMVVVMMMMMMMIILHFK
jgi:hypothetical protein